MIVRKVGKEKWKFSGQMAWSLRHYATSDIDKIEWTLSSNENSLSIFMRKFSADYYCKNRVVFNLTGRAVYMNGSIKILLSERIEY